ncbi:MAG: hypothetical protein FWD13_09405, partial [Treponema sp.]|nr:hypothetical protein [Treponema sp.]
QPGIFLLGCFHALCIGDHAQLKRTSRTTTDGKPALFRRNIHQKSGNRKRNRSKVVHIALKIP